MRRTKSEGVDYTDVYRSNYTWEDHVYRLNVTAGLAAKFDPKEVFDPAAGDGSIVAVLEKMSSPTAICTGDLSAANTDAMMDQHSNWQVFPPMDLITLMDTHTEDHDLIVLTEILEHVPDPRKVLRKAAERAKILIASSPIVEGHEEDLNAEHLWQFDKREYEHLMQRSGWNPLACIDLRFTNPNYYKFQIWAAERK